MNNDMVLYHSNIVCDSFIEFDNSLKLLSPLFSSVHFVVMIPTCDPDPLFFSCPIFNLQGLLLICNFSDNIRVDVP